MHCPLNQRVFNLIIMKMEGAAQPTIAISVAVLEIQQQKMFLPHHNITLSLINLRKGIWEKWPYFQKELINLH